MIYLLMCYKTPDGNLKRPISMITYGKLIFAVTVTSLIQIHCCSCLLACTIPCQMKKGEKEIIM